MGGKRITQVTVKINPEDEASKNFFRRIENRDRELYPTIFSFLNAAVEALDVSTAGGSGGPVLAEEDLWLIEMTMLEALRIYEMKKKEEQMVP